MNTPPELSQAIRNLEIIHGPALDDVLQVIEDFFKSPKGLTMLAASSILDQSFELQVTSKARDCGCDNPDNHR